MLKNHQQCVISNVVVQIVATELVDADASADVFDVEGDEGMQQAGLVCSFVRQLLHHRLSLQAEEGLEEDVVVPVVVVDDEVVEEAPQMGPLQEEAVEPAVDGLQLGPVQQPVYPHVVCP